MSTITPADVLRGLSSYELALLLMSAYLHDIGMTPEVRKVRQLHVHLLTGEPGDLRETELSEFQRWLDDHADGLVPPIAPSGVTGDLLRHSGYLITHYCRSRHNDWSEEWIRYRLSGEHLGTYGGWLEDLVALCRSHHYGYEEVRSDKFDPRLATSDGMVVHLRFLAAVLRVADILEFDPERTPEVIFRHRDISPSSVIYWWKDHDIALRHEGARLIVAARPTTATAHRAIELTLDDIDRELELCRRLAAETHFEKCPGLHHDLPHRWDLEGAVHRDIRPRDGKYEYIDGAFRPNTPKLLELLSGLEMYGVPMVAVRELLQNAFDAVREQSAHQRLEQPLPGDQVLADSVSRLHRVELRLEEEGGEPWLVCKDTGVGMTKAIIKDHLLVSGSGIRHQVRALERRCKDAGFQLGRTGQFGIGVLSYFMLCDRVVIRTRRSQQAGDGEATGWRFETDGVGSFGELREDVIPKGTEVRLHLRADVVGPDLSGWFASLVAYLGRVVGRVPCELQVNSPLPGCEAAIYPTGWVERREEMSRGVVDGLRQKSKVVGSQVGKTPRELLPLSRRMEKEEADRQTDEVAEEIARCLRWRVREGSLPGGLGTYRLNLPYFELPNGTSLAFLRVGEKDGGRIELSRVGVGNAYWPDGVDFTSWKGIRVRVSSKRHEGYSYATGVLTEIDFEGAESGRLLVSRDSLIASTA